MKFVFRFLCAALASTLFLATPVAARTIVLGHVNQPAYEATAIIIQTIIERLGYNVAVKYGSYDVMYAMLADGEIDMFVAASLPNENAELWEEYKDKMTLLTPLYEDARQFWAVPKYIPASAVKSVADLSKPDVAQKMEKVIRGPAANSSLMNQSEKLMQEYGLTAAGYELTSGKSEDWIANFNANVKAKKWFVVPLWQPHFLNQVAELRILREPKQLLGKSDTAWLITQKGAKKRFGKTTYEILKKMELSTKWVDELEYMVNVEKMTPRTAARQWMGLHPYTVEYWTEPDEE